VYYNLFRFHIFNLQHRNNSANIDEAIIYFADLDNNLIYLLHRLLKRNINISQENLITLSITEFDYQAIEKIMRDYKMMTIKRFGAP